MNLRFKPGDRRSFIGGSDARVIMGDDEAALTHLWKEKRGEAEPEDLSGNLIVQLGVVTEHLNRHWYERNTGHTLTDIQRRVIHPVIKWMAATLDGMVEPGGAVFEAKFMLPWSFSEEAAAEKYMPQLQHNMWVTNATIAVLSIITGGGKWVEITIAADSLYQHLLLTAEKKFWRCVENGEPPRLFFAEPPRPRIEAIRVVDMSVSNTWAEFAGLFRQTRTAFLQHENAKTELKGLMPEDAKEAIGHGIRAKRSKSGAISFDLLELEEADPCSTPVNRSAPSRVLSPRLRSNSPIRRNRWWRPFDPRSPERVTARSAMPHSPAGSTLSARLWASTRSRPCRPLPSTSSRDSFG
jgi:hypothetical protein